MAKLSQCARILQHLMEHGSITHLEAEKEYGIMRLASRINDLRAEGIEIESKIVKGKNRCGETTHYAEYRLKGETA